MGNYKYIISNRVYNAIDSFYYNVARKYINTYSYELIIKNMRVAYSSIYRIENGLLRRQPTMSRWKGLYMAKAGKWYFAYKVEGDTVYVYDACHAQNMHEIAKPRRRYTVRLTEEDLRQVIKKSIREALKQFYSAE